MRITQIILRLLLLPGFLVFGAVVLAQQPSETPEVLAKKTLSSLTLERKVAQLICAEIRGDASSDDPRVNAWLNLVKNHGVGGFVIYGGQARNAAILLNKLQQASAIPILISSDFEGGAGQQFEGASEFPPNMAFAATRDEDLMNRAARIMAKEGRAIGVHLSYTPVVDISVSSDNPQESGRSFGADLALLNTMVKAYVAGYHKEGMLVAAKHFPGRGDMKGGPAYPSFTTLPRPLDQLEQQEFRAFSHAVAAGVDWVMTEHISVPAATGGSTLPASVEPKLTKGILRQKLKFKGIVTTDDLWYDHVVARFGRDEVAVLALEAGHDIILKPKDPVTAMQAIVAAVKSGRIPQTQIDSSVYKLLLAKHRLGLFDNRTVDTDVLASVSGTAEHHKLIEQVTDRSVTLLKNDSVLPLKKSIDPLRTVHVIVQKTNDQPNVAALKAVIEKEFKGVQQFSIAPDQDKKIYADILRAAGSADVVLVSLLVQRDRHGDPAPLSREVAGVLDGMARSLSDKVIMMSFGNPFLINKLPGSKCFLTGYGEGGFYGNQVAYFSSFVRVLKGELKPGGKLPLTVSADLPMGHGIQY